MKQEGVQELNYPKARFFSSLNQLIFGGGQSGSGNKVIINCPAPSANRTLNIPTLVEDSTLLLKKPTVAVTGISQALSVNKSYYLSNASLTSLSLPSSAVQDDEIEIISNGNGLFEITQATSQKIRFGDKVTVTGATGKLSSVEVGAVVRLKYNTTDNLWFVIFHIGNFDNNQ